LDRKSIALRLDTHTGLQRNGFLQRKSESLQRNWIGWLGKSAKKIETGDEKEYKSRNGSARSQDYYFEKIQQKS
jgi:hypothetical protein